MKDTETLDRLYLEWSQFTRAKTEREIAPLARRQRRQAVVDALDDAGKEGGGCMAPKPSLPNLIAHLCLACSLLLAGWAVRKWADSKKPFIYVRWAIMRSTLPLVNASLWLIKPYIEERKT